MSQCLKEREYFLGRNARMLACLAPERLAAADDESQVSRMHIVMWPMIDKDRLLKCRQLFNIN